MTDNEIIKALEICISGDCDLCSCKCENVGDCRDALNKKSLDLINRQKAEIERLETNLKEAFAEIEELKRINLHCESEAVKKFAERLKEYVESYDVTTGYKIIIVNAVEEETIDNLVKEMVGEG